MLDVVVTGRGLCIKGIWPMCTFIGMSFDLAHKVPLSSIRLVAASWHDKSRFALRTRRVGSAAWRWRSGTKSLRCSRLAWRLTARGTDTAVSGIVDALRSSPTSDRCDRVALPRRVWRIATWWRAENRERR